MQIVDPADQFRHFHRGDVEIHDQALLARACQDAVQLRLLAAVDLLVRNVGWHVDEVARGGFRDELQLVAPA